MMMMMYESNYFALHFVKPNFKLASNIFEFDIHIKPTLTMTSYGYILGIHINNETRVA
jgi:hypothetical protein